MPFRSLASNKAIEIVSNWSPEAAHQENNKPLSEERYRRWKKAAWLIGVIRKYLKHLTKQNEMSTKQITSKW